MQDAKPSQQRRSRPKFLRWKGNSGHPATAPPLPARFLKRAHPAADLRKLFAEDFASHPSTRAINEACLSRQVADGDKVLRLVTYNVHGLAGYHTPSLTGRKHMERLLRDVDADVVCLQEMPPKSAASFKEYPHRAEVRLGHWICNVILSKHPLENVRAVPFKTCSTEARGFVCATLDLPFGRGKLGIVCTHLDVWDESGNERAGQAAELLAAAHSTSLFPHASHVVLCGDFNAVHRPDYPADHWDWMVAQNESRGLPPPPCHEMALLLLETCTREYESSTSHSESADAASAAPLARAGAPFLDAFSLGSAVPPAVTAWTFRRVDFVLLRAQDAWENMRVAPFVVYNPASDHLPVGVDFVLSDV